MFSLVAAPAAGRETPLAVHLFQRREANRVWFITRDVSVSTFLSPSLEGHLASAKQGRRARGAGVGVGGSSAHLEKPDPIIATPSSSQTATAPPASGYNNNSFGTEYKNVAAPHALLLKCCYISGSE